MIHGHGRLMDPPSRNAMWRFGYPNPVNYNDNELFCGGYAGSSSQTAINPSHNWRGCSALKLILMTIVRQCIGSRIKASAAFAETRIT